MSLNPLQQFFRQPKIFIELPSGGIYNNPGTIKGDPTHLPIHSMTGMDEIIVKTPDALLSGESTVKVIESCCPNITNAWDLSSLDLDLVLIAIRIATYGNLIGVIKICPKCSAENHYDVDLNNFVDHFRLCKYDNKLVLKDFTIKIRPLSYRQSTDYSLRNFQIQQQLKQVGKLEDEEEKKEVIAGLFKDMAILQNNIFTSGIESVEFGNTIVTEKQFIEEWLENCDKSILDALKKHISKMREAWSIPPQPVKCAECETESSIILDLDQSSFFANA